LCSVAVHCMAQCVPSRSVRGVAPARNALWKDALVKDPAAGACPSPLRTPRPLLLPQRSIAR
jgi:hypothetical protein